MNSTKVKKWGHLALAVIGILGVLVAVTAAVSEPKIHLEPIGHYNTGIFDEGAAEIVAYDAGSQRLFVTNANDGVVDVLDLSDPSSPALLHTIDLPEFSGGVNSVAVHDGLVAVAAENEEKTEPGQAVFLDVDGNLLSAVTVGALPDMVTFTPDGRYALIANEGEPNDDYDVDPEGSVSIIDLSGGVANLSQNNVHTASFSQFNNQRIDPLIRVFGPNATVAQDLEPEYIAVSDDSRLAWVTLQENNALATIDIASAQVISLQSFGLKDHSQPENALDVSNRDDVINITTWPVYGMYQPDAIAAFTIRGQQYLITANEGDARDYDGYSEEERVKDLELDPTAFPDADTLQEDENLGRLTVTTAQGDLDGDGDFDAIWSFGARSFSIWSRQGNLVYDSGNALEQITAATLPEQFNSTNDENDSFDNRSDDKGPEPEGIAVGVINGRTYAFIGLERIGGIVVYDVTNPTSPQFVEYINTRDFSGDAEAGTAGDLAPEGLTFIPASESPNGNALLVVGYEVSGSVTIFNIGQ
ncbi:MAG: choice-of-anchor I family protein [Ardenticatenaceae bacterium]|nr:choice-of-anchor I family protein [Ardenticatenaceae bacterium]MCB8949493.1 choice-of-anchor I family protein [Ardenticatenaceae bacterium]